MSSAPKSVATFECVFDARRSSRAYAGESLRRSRAGRCEVSASRDGAALRVAAPRGALGLNFSRFCGIKFGRPSSLRAIFAFTASRRFVGRVSDAAGRSGRSGRKGRDARSARSSTNFAARDTGLEGLESEVRDVVGLKAFFGFSNVRSSRLCLGFPFGAPSISFDLDAVRSWKRCARSFERSAKRTSFFVTTSRSE